MTINEQIQRVIVAYEVAATTETGYPIYRPGLRKAIRVMTPPSVREGLDKATLAAIAKIEAEAKRRREG